MSKTNMRFFLGMVAALVVVGRLGLGTARADYAYYYPYFASSDGELIGLALTNASGDAATVSIVVRDESGVVQATENWSLPARGQKADVIGADLNLKGGSFQVFSDRPLTGLCFLFTNNMTTMYDIPGTQKLCRNLVFPQVAQSANWDTSIVMSNPGASEVNVSLRYRGSDGALSPSISETVLPAGASAVVPLSSLVSDKENGSAELTSTGGIVAYAVYNNFKEEGGKFSAGLTAVDPDDQDENYTPPARSQYAAIAAAAADYSSGAHALVGVEPPRPAQLDLLPTVSDIIMAADGPYFYRIQRYMSDSIIKFAASDPATPIWQFSTQDETGVSSNPHDLIFVDGGHGTSTKAYMPCFGTTKLWIVDPQVTQDGEFKTGEIDLAAYADADGSPEMHRGVIVDGKLFLLLQRLDQSNNFEPGEAYVVVIDVATDQEIDTRSLRGATVAADDSTATGLKGIVLPVKDPWSIAYNAETGKIYVQAVGRFPNTWSGTPADYSGGIVTIDPNTYEVEMLVDDGNDEVHPYGNFSGMALVSATRGYFISYAGWGDNAIWGFNPTTGKVDSAPIAAFSGGSGIATMAVDGHGKLWVGGGNGTVTIIDPANGDRVEQVVHLGLNPTTNGIAFGSWE